MRHNPGNDRVDSGCLNARTGGTNGGHGKQGAKKRPLLPGAGHRKQHDQRDTGNRKIRSHHQGLSVIPVCPHASRKGNEKLWKV